MNHLDLFSGIGGFALAAQTVWGSDYHCVGFCEIDPFCQAMLRKNFEGVTIYGDIRTLSAERLIADANCDRQQTGGDEIKPTLSRQQALYDSQGCGERLAADAEGSNAERFGVCDSRREWAVPSQDGFGLRTEPSGRCTVDLLTGGFPCQPFSTAGKRKGTEDDRFLWPEMLRVIREVKPRWIIGENVAGIVEMALGQVCAELEGLGYEVQCFVIPACAVNAPHRRDRVWIVANRISAGAGGDDGEIGNEGRATSEDWGTRLRQGGGAIGTGRLDTAVADAPQDSISDGCLLGESGEGKPEVRGFGEPGTGDGNGIHLQENATGECPSSDTADLLCDGGNGDERECERCQEVSESGNGSWEKPSSDTSGTGLEWSEETRNIGGGREIAEQRLGEFPESRTFPDWSRDWREVAFESCLRGVDDGLPRRVARFSDGTTISESKWRQEALKCYGNAIVPQVAMEIMRAIQEVDHE